MIARIDPHDAHAFSAWYEAKREGWLAGREEGAVISHDLLRGKVTADRDDAAFQLYAAWEGERITGVLMVMLPLRENRQVAEVTIAVVPEHRGRGLGTRLLAEADRVLAEEGRTVATTEVPVPTGRTRQAWPGSRFALRHGFEVGLEEDALKLALPVDPELLTSLRPDTGSYRLREWTGACPDGMVEAYAHMRTVIQQDMPTGDLEVAPTIWDVERVRALERRMADAGTDALVTAAESAEGELVGFTSLLLPAGQDIVHQEDTLVVDAHRGHRLGTALKVRNLERLAGAFPDRSVVRTWNAVDNTYMRAVNLALGFEVDERYLELQRPGPRTPAS
ncbi:GNAT family N-acetyltransferase [Nocardiopsis ganjiahuensis]|uniref:GNAT family N-acetyltransferase n=1 Tax=Nocardiopsis ganjiahuensis TaxID=239984 RepID=UPI00034A5A8C|nr:GNAT family N-acetyltransferase [Nocardiopsis ganjiahuensis]